MNFDDLSNQYKGSIEDLSKKLVLANKRISELEMLLQSATTITNSTPNLDPSVSINNAILICEIEINRLKEKSMLEQLNMEETKRLDTLVKNLLSLKDSTSKKQISGKSFNEEELLKLVTNE